MHAPATAARLGLDSLAARDLLELYAFVRPASFCLPTPRGLAAALDVTGDDELTLLPRIGDALIDALEDMAAFASPEMKDTATAMARGNWAWGSEVLAALGLDQTRNDQTGNKPRPNFRPGAGLDVWKSLPAWEEPPPPTPPGSQPVEPREARLRLAQMVSAGPNIAEARPTQSDYASAAAEAFAPREAEDKPRVVLVEAGTGVGKTLGYVAPASLWAEKNGGAGLDRDLHPQPAAPDRQRARPAAPRLGREAPPGGDPQGPRELSLPAELPGGGDAHRPGARERRRPRPAGALGAGQPRRRHDRRRLARLAARPARAAAASRRLADRRGECIYSACEHYKKCFVERTIRRARQADIVIANHALVMVQAAMGGLDDATRPLRYVFDEGHHLFDAADGAFAAHLSGVEAGDLRRWILGSEGRRGSRARGLEAPGHRPAGRGRRGAERAAPPARPQPPPARRPTGRRGWPTAR